MPVKNETHFGLDDDTRAALDVLARRMDQPRAKILRIAVEALIAHGKRSGATTTAQLREAMMPAPAQQGLALIGGGRR